ncbi:MAG TPA: hypothetical protein VG101_00960 [Puia sp.]|jgi:hypothetical protein|nr:hypothetical protein [Puia sp.]
MRKLSFLIPGLIGFATSGYAQIQVSQEPRHHKVLENEWVRVLDVHIPPHDTSLMHKHSTPSVFLVLSKTKTGSQVLIEPHQISLTEGNIWFEGFYDTPRIHRVWNEDTVEFHVMDIELLHEPSSSVNINFTPPYCQSLFDEKHVHAFRVTLPPGVGFDLKKFVYNVLVIGLSGPHAAGLVNDEHFTKKGDFLFIPAGADIEIWNDSKSHEQQFALLYLK